MELILSTSHMELILSTSHMELILSAQAKGTNNRNKRDQNTRWRRKGLLELVTSYLALFGKLNTLHLD